MAGQTKPLGLTRSPARRFHEGVELVESDLEVTRAQSTENHPPPFHLLQTFKGLWVSRLAGRLAALL